MLADALYAQHGQPREIMLDEPWMAQFPLGEALAAQRGRHTFGCHIHGVAFGHGYLLLKGTVAWLNLRGYPAASQPVSRGVAHAPQRPVLADRVQRAGRGPTHDRSTRRYAARRVDRG